MKSARILLQRNFPRVRHWKAFCLILTPIKNWWKPTNNPDDKEIESEFSRY